MRIPLFAALIGAASLLAVAAQAQQAAPPAAAPAATPQAAPAAPTPYGLPIDIGLAKKAAAAAVAKAKANGFPSAIAIVGPAGELIYLEKMDNANNSTSDLAIKKAQTAATFRRPSQFFEQALMGGRTLILGLGLTPVGGGIPITIKGRIVGAIGASGAPSSDGDVSAAQAGIEALK